MAVEKIQVPDLGTDETVEVIEVQIKAGDSISENDTLVVLESDKAAMDIPAPKAGVVKKVLVEVGAQVKTGSPLLELEADSDNSAGSDDSDNSADSDSDDSDKAEQSKAAAAKDNQSAASAKASEPEPASKQENKAAANGGGLKAVHLPDLGSDEAAEVIEVLVKVGDEVDGESGLITLETDKAAMDVPASVVGVIKALKVKVGDKVKTGDHIADVELSGDAADSADASSSSAAPDQQQAEAPAATDKTDKEPSAGDKEPSAGDKEPSAGDKEPSAKNEQSSTSTNDGEVYAGPAVRKLARELGVDLTQVSGSGLKGRIQKEDVHAHVKSRMQDSAAAGTSGSGSGIPGVADIDFSKFGKIEEVEMSKLQRVTAANMTKNWLNVPRVTQFDEADITELEEFRDQQKKLAEKKGVKLTPLPFIVKACAQALVEHPQFNVSLHSSGTKLIRKHYVNIGVAVATPAGLMVPVIKNADSKSVFEIASEIQQLAAKAKDRKLSREDMEGACFTVSSLGNLGGTGFTPIVNAPEIAILGVARAAVKPVWNGKKFVPRTMLPFSLAYDHRAVNGVDGGMFSTTLSQLLSDIRLLVL